MSKLDGIKKHRMTRRWRGKSFVYFMYSLDLTWTVKRPQYVHISKNCADLLDWSSL